MGEGRTPLGGLLGLGILPLALVSAMLVKNGGQSTTESFALSRRHLVRQGVPTGGGIPEVRVPLSTLLTASPSLFCVVLTERWGLGGFYRKEFSLA